MAMHSIVPSRRASIKAARSVSLRSGGFILKRCGSMTISRTLIAGLRDGTIDCVATDHAPHAAEEKEVPFEQAAMGVTGLETAFAALHTELVLPGTIELGLLVERMAGGAEPFGLEQPTLAPGSEANVVLCDLAAEWTVGEEGYESRSENSWCAGRALTGRVLMTLAGGQVAYRLRSFSLGVAA